MIEFLGCPTGECKKYICKVESTIGLIVSLTLSLAVSVPIIIATLMVDWIFIIAILPLIVFIFLASKKPSGKTLDLILPTRVSIKEDSIESESKAFFISRKLSEVKSVVDMGEWYQINFKFPHKSTRFVCQKSLITQGTIEEFEKLFNKKIVIVSQNKTQL